MAASTATYMGLRTWRYTPPTTRRSGAATGAGVPKPSTTKRTNALTSTISPARSSNPPSTRTGAQYGRGSRACQRVNNHGIRPTTTPGATRKNTALPTAAFRLRIATPRSQLSRGRRMRLGEPKSLHYHREDSIRDLLRRGHRTITAPVQRGPEDRPAHHRGHNLRVDRPAVSPLRRRLYPAEQELVELTLHPRLDERPELPI